MEIKKETQINFIYNGKIVEMNIVFDRYISDKIPLFRTTDIAGVKLLRLFDNSLLILADINTTNEVVEILTWHGIFKIYFKNTTSDLLCDSCCAHYYGFNRFINILEESSIDSESKKLRIDNLEKVFRTKKLQDSLTVPSRTEVLENIKVVTII